MINEEDKFEICDKYHNEPLGHLEPDTIEEPEYRRNIRHIVKTFYDLQKIRIAHGNRVYSIFCERYEKNKDEKEEVIENVRKNYYRLIDGLNDNIKSKLKKDNITPLSRAETIRNMKKIIYPEDSVIKNMNELIIVEQYEDILGNEIKQKKFLEYVISNVKFYTDVLSKFVGIGPCMGGVLISEINIYKSKYPSSIHMYAGLDVVNGEGRSKKEHHLVDRKYIDKNGEEQTKKSITFNPFLKSKLMGVLADSFIKIEALTKKPKYSISYYNYKNRIKNRCNLTGKNLTPGHINSMAKRYMIKIFLTELYNLWRDYEKLPVYNTYQEEKLNHTWSKKEE